MKDFPKFSFQTVRMDTCKICDSLKIKSRSKVSSLAKEVKTELDVYHRKVEEVFKVMKNSAINSTLPEVIHAILQ